MDTYRSSRPRFASRRAPGPVVALVAVLAAAALTGCGSGDDAEVTPVRSSSASSPEESPSSPATTVPVPSPTPTGQPAGPRKVTVRGMVSAGVEPGCLLLTAEPGGGYQLIGGDRSVLRPGRMVEVAGVLQPDLLTTCQQGIPLKVERARAL